MKSNTVSPKNGNWLVGRFIFFWVDFLWCTREVYRTQTLNTNCFGNEGNMSYSFIQIQLKKKLWLENIPKNEIN